MVALAALTAGCSGTAKPQVASATPTVTATVTATVTPTPITTAPAPTPTLSPTPKKISTTRPTSGSSGSGSDHVAIPANTTDRSSVLTHAKYVVEDIHTGDQRIASGDPSGLDRTMQFLQEDFQDLLDDGAPPHVNAKSYLANLAALADLAGKGSAYFADGRDTDGAAAFSVVRDHAQDTLDQINKAYGVHLALK